MAILNIRHDKDLITIDFRMKQIRYLTDVDEQGEILFFDFGDIFENLDFYIGNDNEFIKKVVKEEVKGIWNKDLEIKKMRIIL